MTKLLSQLLNGFAEVSNDVSISSMTLDAREVEQGGLFLAVQGSQAHGLRYASQAIENGASVVVYEDSDATSEYLLDVAKDVRFVAVKHLSQHVSAIAARFYGHPSDDLSVVAITGTNGKTTCAYLLAQMLEAQGKDVAIVGTLGSGRINELTEAGLTTPDAVSLQRRLAEFKNDGIEYIVMEASSHALDQHRLDAVKVDVAAFTNLSQDHLDYHGSMGKYLAAKGRLFEFASLRAAVVNADSDATKQLLSLISSDVEISAFSISAINEVLRELFGEYCLIASDIAASSQRTVVALNVMNESHQLKTQLIGDFNVANLLLCLQVMGSLGFEREAVFASVTSLVPPPGRLQRVAIENAPAVVVDYAHTPDALENALETLSQIEHDDLVAVFGCGGDRDKTKRPLMAGVAERLADVVVVTDDNPRTEASQEIIADVLKGLMQPEKALVISDRAEAIKQSVAKAKLNDIVLIAGKGHEDYQIVGSEKLAFSDYQYAYAALQEWRDAA